MQPCSTPWIRRGAAALSFVAIAASADAAVIDQGNLITSVFQVAEGLNVSLDSSTGGKGSLMQSFTPTFDRLDWAAAGMSARTDLLFQARIWGTGDSGTVLGTSASRSAASTGFGRCDDGFVNCDLEMTEFAFDTAITLTPGATYLLEVLQISDYTAGRGSWSSTQTGFPTIDPATGYGGGSRFFDGKSDALNDLIFATGLQRATDEPPANDVPIAPTWTLAALGLLAGAAVRRRQPQRRRD